jgi:hypothetical protein
MSGLFADVAVAILLILAGVVVICRSVVRDHDGNGIEVVERR